MASVVHVALPAAQTSVTEDGSAGSYTTRELIRDIPLDSETNSTKGYITCVDTWNGNVYIGTSNGEVLHYVSIPGEKEGDAPVYIFATRIEPRYTTAQTGAHAGVKQILLLPSINKACIVCNSTLTFYNIPELSPAFEDVRQAGCLWVGGRDRNVKPKDEDGVRAVVVICLRQRLRLIGVGDDSRPIKIRDIELGAVSLLERRGDLACVADGQEYSLLDVVNQRKNVLFPISSTSSVPAPPQQLALPATPGRPAARSFSSRSPVRQGRAHQRITSLGGQPQNTGRLRPDSNSPFPPRHSSRQGAESPAVASSREDSPNKAEAAAASATVPEEADADATTSSSSRPSAEIQRPASPEKPKPLPPNIVTPTPDEFLLTTGTSKNDPGVGMFVNLEGDVVRGTIEFASYPESLVLHGAEPDADMPHDPLRQGFVLAVVQRDHNGTRHRCIEVQRWDAEPGEAQSSKEWLPIEQVASGASEEEPAGVGLRTATSPSDLATTGISASLRLRKLKVKGSDAATEDNTETARNIEEDKLASRFAQVRANVLLYAGNRVSWVVQEPLLMRLDRQLSGAMQRSEGGALSIDVPTIQRAVNSIRGQDPRDELEFLTLTYVRQKAALLLFGNLVLQTSGGIIAYEHDKRRAEDALTSGEIDPRIMLMLVPPLDKEISEGPGIWLPQGLRDTIDWLRDGIGLEHLERDVKGAYGDNMLSLTKRYLTTWRKKKGFGSVADEAHVFKTVDAALLHVLLLLDQNSPRGAALPGSIRTELYGVVDKGVDCYERAVELLEQHQRLYVLSRLYQNKQYRDISKVLATWRRILVGEHDAGGEFIEGEHVMREYLAKIRDTSLVQEYGSWLANRNPRLGVQIFADDTSRVQFEPSQAIAILKEKAPDAVKDYLEHLVFGKNHVQYVNDLIAYYLDTVLDELKKNNESRVMLRESYEIYRAQIPPKPTYRQFITDNAVEAEWWHNRLRLLQLIGGSHGAASKYNVHTLGERLAPYSDELVPEMIILNGREGKHEEALRLLVHGLGDYDTSIRYCLLGGSSIFHPSSDRETVGPLPSKDEQSILFNFLLDQFFQIQDYSERLERTAELLERFGGWFDVAKVLEMIPNSWSVELVGGFLVHALRRLVAEKNETVIVKALCTAQNIKKSVDAIDLKEKMGPIVMVDQGDVGEVQS
ncbi:Putative vacuolar sorting protein 39/Transforming growth factor beta receptor-associated domain 2 [Septoria linicola]|uniref:Vacuolar sorting protein 39/Transforming growth factor beta receptor-associated domain 2 n=1 Tax=Septoria linicola TaxID=215465 RepID=A0A9Q9AP03_9PEZI|nr:putative vacuolar sorting protein 39/Transforming growth factor beta receptor-associated domain 2 [Septoria linicola]USW49588.1 Putative vacuolar sorting protein 39/Transforming growth factor beta receptor-associated domain 2 [Septoria linicola]